MVKSDTQVKFTNMVKPYVLQSLIMTCEELKCIRERLKMNQTEFAKFLNVPYRTYYKWEAGNIKTPPIAITCFKMLKCLMVNELLDDYSKNSQTMEQTAEDILNEILADTPKAFKNDHVQQLEPELKDVSKSAQMHLINLTKKYQKGSIPISALQQAETDFTNGNYERVISLGESAREPTAAEIREVERSFSSMEEPKTVPTALTTERIERLIRHLKS